MVNESKAGSQLTSNYKWEILGDDVVALDSDEGRVFRLTGPSAAVATFMLDGSDHGLTAETFNETVLALVDEGLVVVSDSGISRRRMLGAGTAALAGISILMLPTAAAAASSGGAQQQSPGLGGTTTSSSSTSSTTTTLVDNLPDPNVSSLSNSSISWTQPDA